MIELGARLEFIARYIKRGSRLADIGCDHGRLCVAMIQRDQVKNAIATDYSKESLKKAELLALKLGVEDRLDCRVGDGLVPIRKDEVDCVVIAGMGGNEIANILTQGIDKLSNEVTVIMQPMQQQGDLRYSLIDMGFCIIDEELVFEKNRIFDIVVSKKGKESDYDLRYKEVGSLLWQKRHPLLKDRVERKLKARIRALDDIGVSNKVSSEITDPIKKDICMFKEMLKWL